LHLFEEKEEEKKKSRCRPSSCASFSVTGPNHDGDLARRGNCHLEIDHAAATARLEHDPDQAQHCFVAAAREGRTVAGGCRRPSNSTIMLLSSSTATTKECIDDSLRRNVKSTPVFLYHTFCLHRG
jgi:hypothetical protein